MSAVSAHRIADLLTERFTATPVLVWRDIDGAYQDALAEITTAVDRNGLSVTTHHVTGDEFGTKHRVYTALNGHQPDNARHLVYSVGERPRPRDNWLLDLEVGFGVFTADTTSILVHDLGLEDRGVIDVVTAHANVFDSAQRTEAVRDHVATLPPSMPAEQLSATLRASMSAAVLGLRGPGCHRLHRLVEALFTDLADESTRGFDTLARHGLDTFLWEGCARIYGYASPNPTVAGLATWIFDQAWREWPDATNAARIDFERLRGERGLRPVFTALANRAQDDLNIADRLRADRPAEDQLAGYDVFPVIDAAFLDSLAAAVLGRTLPAQRIADLVRKRSTTTWFDDHEHTYRTLAAAADCLGRIEAFTPVITDAAAGIRSYANNWSAIDRGYRTFRYHHDHAEDALPQELIDRVEHNYIEKYQRPLADAWQQQVDKLETWQIAGVRPLGSFAAQDLPAKAKTLVVISDALRYEVGSELADRMNADDWFTATIEPRLAPLPSFTQLGMASHLPHQQLELVEALLVRADDSPTNGKANRAALWKQINVAALDYDDVTSMRADELGKLWSDHAAVVVYHDVIDSTGDKAASERRTPEACARTIDEIAGLVKRFGKGKIRASRVLVTADHGFLFQASELESGYFLSERAHGEEIVALKRRFVLGRGLRDDPAFKLWTASQLGLRGDLQVQIPRSLYRLRAPGTGVRFVHGGATLQEVVVPLVTLTQSRSKDTSKVTVALGTNSPTITSSTVLVTLTQNEPVTGKRRGRTLHVGVWFGAELISGLKTVQADSTSTDIRDRFLPFELVLSEEAGEHNGKTVEIRADEVVGDTVVAYLSTSVTLQRGFGGFFDAL